MYKSLCHYQVPPNKHKQVSKLKTYRKYKHTHKKKQRMLPFLNCGNQLDPHPWKQFSSNWTMKCRQHQYYSPCCLPYNQTDYYNARMLTIAFHFFFFFQAQTSSQKLSTHIHPHQTEINNILSLHPSPQKSS